MICFHHNDLDGICAGAIVKKFCPKCAMYQIDYSDEFPFKMIKRGDTVYMVDFSIEPFSDMLKLNKLCNLIWIDHHPTAIKASEEHDIKIEGIRKVGISGCELTWIYLTEKATPNFSGLNAFSMPLAVRLLGRYDVWDLNFSPEVLPFQEGMKLYTPKEVEPSSPLWKTLLKGGDNIQPIIENGKKLLKYRKSQDEKYAKKFSFEGIFEGLKAIFVNRGLANSLLLESVFNPKKHDIMVVFCMLPDKRWTVNLYSDIPKINCGEIAFKYGGGGHDRAAGFITNDLWFLPESRVTEKGVKVK